MAQTTREQSPLSAAVAAQVRAERAAAGLSREQACALTHLPMSTYRRVESGERVATITQLANIAAGFGMRTSELLERAERRVQMAEEGMPRDQVDVADLILQADLETRERHNLTRGGECS